MVDIPINDVTPRNRYEATAGQTVFDYDFPILDADHIRVQETDPNDLNNPITLVRGVDYNVTGVGDEIGGTIVLLVGEYPTGAAEDDIYTLTRVLPYERLNDYQFSGDFESSDVNNDFDTVVMMVQQLNRLLLGTARLDDTDALTSLPIKIESATRRGARVLGFNAAGDGLETGPLFTDVDILGQYITEINAVGDNIASVITTANNIGNVNTVAGSIGNVNSVGNNIASVVTVAASMTNVNTVAGSIANVNTVAGAIANVNTVATNISNVNTVATNIAAVGTVSTNIAAVNSAASNMAAIIAAPGAAADAATARDFARLWATQAEDVGVNDGVNPAGFSAYHWAQKAAAAAGGGLVKISSNDTTAGYVKDKVTAAATSGISLTETNDGGNETLAAALNIVGMTADTTPAQNDSIATYDLSATSHKKVAISDFYKTVNGLTALTAPATGDSLLIYDVSASAALKITLDQMFKIINGFTTDATPDFAADFLPTYDTSAAGVKKVALSQFAKAADAVPVGTPMPWAANALPTGYLKMNGAAVSRTTYAALFAVLGTTWGAGDGSTTFNLPDWRGEFVRGFDDGRGVDTSRVFASAQADALQGFRVGTPSGGYYDYASNAATGSTINLLRRGSDTLVPITDGVNGTPRLAAETRPRNVTALWVIKF